MLKMTEIWCFWCRTRAEKDNFRELKCAIKNTKKKTNLVENPPGSWETSSFSTCFFSYMIPLPLLSQHLYYSFLAIWGAQSVADLSTWLSAKADALSYVAIDSMPSSEPTRTVFRPPTGEALLTAPPPPRARGSSQPRSSTTPTKKCTYCARPHWSDECRTYASLADRRKRLKDSWQVHHLSPPQSFIHRVQVNQTLSATTARGTMASIIAACVLDNASQHMERLPRQNERPKRQPLRRPQVPLSSRQNQHPSSLRMRKSWCKRQQPTSATWTHLLHVQELPASFSTLAANGLTSQPTSLNSCN